MGRKKQARPRRSGGMLEDLHSNGGNLENSTGFEDAKTEEKFSDSSEPFLVEIDWSSYNLDEHHDIAEIILTDLKFSEGYCGYRFAEDFRKGSKFSLRFLLQNVEEFSSRLRLGHWPVISADCISLEFLETRRLEDKETKSVILTGSFDGPDEGVSGLVHLVSQKILMLRLVNDPEVEEVSSLRVRVEIFNNAFVTCDTLLENTRQLWKRSMMNVMAWLRPEAITPEAIYGSSKMNLVEFSTHKVTGSGSFVSKKRARFDAAQFYEAIKPSKLEPMLEDELRDLLPELRPYQRRAVYWMVQREKGASGNWIQSDQSYFCSPLCVPVGFLDTRLKMFYNPFSGAVSLHPEPFSYVPGGILADEMGLGKSVELLACILAHRKFPSEDEVPFHNEKQVTGGWRNSLKRLKRERVECICRAVSESSKYKGLWVQCDICDAWQHADCVGYVPVGTNLKYDSSHVEGHCKNGSVKLQKQLKKKGDTKIVEMDGSHICQPCSELIQATECPVATGATLIVCPTPILPQWRAEIIRHTNPGSLKTCVYEGVRNASPSTMSIMDLSEFINADIVLTTYEVLKEDLSHDSDRHEGDRRSMRFQKRYPVVPTFLTRIFWWRVCLDEAQMVESNATAATEMALRLHAKHLWCITGTPIQRRFDDLYGLLRFLRASPFDIYRWWVDVIRDPYERGDANAMEFAHKFFKQIMWRSSKVHVADELQLPPQEECVSWLFFSPIEAHFYQRQHETCVSCAHEVIESFKDDINKRKSLDSESFDASCDLFLTHTEAAKLLNSLLKLRQACCHPQVGSSGLRSLQQSPMTMEEILVVLVGKTKTEGEEALRKSVVALNGLAGIAIIEKDLFRAVSLYREALSLAKEHSDDFRLDPLLNLHIHHNLSEILPLISSSDRSQSVGGQSLENPEEMASKLHEIDDFEQYSAKRQKISKASTLDSTGHLEHEEELLNFSSNLSAIDVEGEKGTENDAQSYVSSRSFSDGCLRKTCENIKQKYLSVFISKLSLAQQEFKNSYMEVCEALSDRKKQQDLWWLEALHYIEQNKDSSNELIRKIREAVSGTLNSSKASRLASRFRSIDGLKYLIQGGLDSLETSRQAVLERLLEVDQTMERPRDEDIERVRYCPKCVNGDGPLCVLCELDELFQVYEARLFRLTRGDDGGMIASAEEAVDLQKKISARNQFYMSLSRPDKGSASSNVGNEEDKRKRDVRAKVVVSRSPSELEIVLGVIKNYSKAHLGREGMSAATKQLLLFEAIRKEYTQARSLATVQAQLLRAHDEIKMATSRLRLRETENDASALDALSSEELVAANVEFSNEKFISLSLLSRIRGQLRYLKGLVISKKKPQSESFNVSSFCQDSVSSLRAIEQSECTDKVDDEACPICQEKLSNQKMVFQCGHVTCCKCFVAMTEQRQIHHGKSQDKWVMCPTCRQHTHFGNIAFADDRQNKTCNSDIPSAFQGHDNPEGVINVQGSYGTKLEAVTRRILWIKSTDPKAKVLVFSSWNDVLDVLEHALVANGISYIRMKGGRKSHAAISQFKGQNRNVEGIGKIHDQQGEPKSIQVLLLLIQHGANGLNLLEAQHVVLVEPLLNPAAEAQAINRVHRIGQEKMTLVHRFIVKDTVEESIYKLNRGRTGNFVISGNTKNQDQPVLTLKDVESLFSTSLHTMPLENNNEPRGSLMHLPPVVAAALAAERRLRERST